MAHVQDPLRIAVTAQDRSTAPRLRELLLAQTRSPIIFVDRERADVEICDRDPGPTDDRRRVVVIDPASGCAARRMRRALARARDCARGRADTARGDALTEALFEHTESAQALVGRSGTILRVNAPLAELLGVAADELVGRHVDELLEPGERRHDLRTFRRRRVGGRRQLEGAHCYRYPPHSSIALRASVRPIADASGRTLYLLVRAATCDGGDPLAPRSIDDGALVASMRRIQAIARRGSDARILFNESLRHFQRLTGSPDALLGLVEPDADDALMLRPIAVQSPRGFLGHDRVGTTDGIAVADCCAVMANAMASRQPAWTADAGRLWTTPEGEFAAQRVLVIPIALDGASTLAVVLANAPTNYTAATVERLEPFTATCSWVLSNCVEGDRRAAAVEELIESRRTLESMLAHLPVMVYRCADDDQRSLLFASEGCRALTGLSPDELLDPRFGAWLPFVHPADRDQVLGEVRWSVLQQQRFDLTYRTRRADGEEHWVWEQGQGVRSPEGELLFVEGFAMDVTDQRRADEDRRRLESRLRRSHKLEGLAVLADGIAHDFNNLLVGVLGHAQLLREHVDSDPPSAAALEGIEHTVERAAELTEHMLSYTGQGGAALGPLDLAETLLHTRSVLERLVPKESSLRFDLESTTPPVEGDAGLLQRALVELVRNAVEALPPAGGSITLSCRARPVPAGELTEAWLGARLPAGRFVTIEVADSGSGMAETVRQRAFDPFFTTKGAGRGMGLATVLGVVRSHGGAVHLGPNSGGGTCVTLIFPPVESPPARDCDRPDPVGLRASQTATILIVDDEAVVREVAECALTRAGYSVLCAEDGEDALDLFDRTGGTVDAVLLDLTMPRLGGEATFEALRERRTDLPILLSSGFAEHTVMDTWSSAPGVHFLHKPYRLDDLIARIERALATGEPSP